MIMRLRRAKLENEVAVYHCVSRIVGGQMLLDTHAKEVLRKQMRYMADFCGVELVTYCIMTNHFHLLVRVPEKQVVDDSELVRRFKILYEQETELVEELEEVLASGGKDAVVVRARLLARMGDISLYLKELKQRFSIWYNKNHDRVGTLWAERFRSVLVEDGSEALRCVAAYIDLNSVRAGIVEDPKDYRWCGYAEAVSGESYFEESFGQLIADKSSIKQIMAEYRMLLFIKGATVKGGGKVAIRDELVAKVLNNEGYLPASHVLRLKIRYFTAGKVLGSCEFVERVYQEHREEFSEKRQQGAQPVGAFEEIGMTVLAVLRGPVFW